MIDYYRYSVPDRCNNGLWAQPNGDIAIQITGIREGEKLYEELFYDPDKALRTRHPKILCAEKRGTKAQDIPCRLLQMQQMINSNDVDGARSLLFEYISNSN